MFRKQLVTVGALLLSDTFLLGASLQAQTQLAPPAPRPLPAPTASSPHFVGNVNNIRALPNGQLLINDTRIHHLMLSDSMLKTTTVVIDSGEYGSRPASLMSYFGDSSLFVEAITPSMRVIDPSGKVVRTIAVPQASSASSIMPTTSGMAGVDARGRIVHRGFIPRPPKEKLKAGETRLFDYPDTNPIVRDDPETHQGMTLAFVKGLKISGVDVAIDANRSAGYIRSTPVYILDEWAMLSNGMIAVVRGTDYHIDLIGPDNKITSLPKIPHTWIPLPDSLKLAIIDSIRKAENESRDEQLKQAADKKNGTGTSSASGATSAGGSTIGSGGFTGGRPTDFPPPPPIDLYLPRIEDFPDYYPVFSFGALHPDVDGNLWIHTELHSPDGKSSVYDVVSSAGKLIDRILIPDDRSIVGFDKHGNVFLTAHESRTVVWIERVHWKA
ncbi:MAG: hypothetical protein ABJB66_16435 [Gemmatimonadaceae bacterium]